MICLQPQNKRFFCRRCRLFYVLLLWFIVHTMNSLLFIFSSLYLWVEIFLFRCFQIHSQIMEFLCPLIRCLNCRESFVFLISTKEIIGSSMLVCRWLFTFLIFWWFRLNIERILVIMASIFLIAKIYIVWLKVYDWSFFVRSKKGIFVLQISSFERLNWTIIEIRWREISNAFSSLL